MTSQKPALPLDRARVRALLFDVDGTLSDSDDHMVSRFAGKLSFLDGLFKQGSSNRVARSFVHFAESPGNWLFEMADRLNLDPHLAAFLDRRAKRSRTGKLSCHHWHPAHANGSTRAVSSRYCVGTERGHNPPFLTPQPT